MARGVLGAVGIGIMLFSGFFVAFALGDLLTGGDGETSTGTLVGLFMFFGGILLAGAFLTWWAFLSQGAQRGRAPDSGSGSGGSGEPASPSTDAEREQAVLRFAEIEHGRVTLPEVAANCRMTIVDAKATLDRMVLQGVATLQVTKSGVLVYVFPGFMSDEDKAKATDF